MYSALMRGGWWLAGFLAAMYVAIWCYTASDGPGGVKLQAPFACLLLGSAASFGCTSTGLWAIRHQARQLREHVDTQLEQHRVAVRADTERLIGDEITHVLPRLDTQMLHAVQRAFRAEAETLTKVMADRGYRSGLVARAAAAVPNQPGGRILPIRRARED